MKRITGVFGSIVTVLFGFFLFQAPLLGFLLGLLFVLLGTISLAAPPEYGAGIGGSILIFLAGLIAIGNRGPYEGTGGGVAGLAMGAILIPFFLVIGIVLLIKCINAVKEEDD